MGVTEDENVISESEMGDCSPFSHDPFDYLYLMVSWSHHGGRNFLPPLVTLGHFGHFVSCYLDHLLTLSHCGSLDTCLRGFI